MAVLHFLEDAADPTARYVIRYPKSAAVGELPGHPFEREAALLSEPLHPNIVRVLSYGKDADLGLQFQLLPWLPGRTLTQWVEARSVENVLSPAPWNAESLERVSELAKGLWSVLGTLERLNLVHRDLHPGNIMIHGNHFTVIDFTTSVRVGEEPSFAVYTKDFSAPESIEPRPASFAVDVYGWGASVLYAFTGVNPEVLRWETQHSFPRDTFRERVRQHLETIPIEAGLCFAVEPWTEVLAKALSEEPSERYPNATALAQALDRIFGGPAWRAAVPADNK